MIPPAAYVSNNYIDKFSDALPWSIIAGPRRGVVGGTGVQSLEFAFDKNDRDVLEPFGYNPIVFERGVGLTIKGNNECTLGSDRKFLLFNCVKYCYWEEEYLESWD